MCDTEALDDTPSRDGASHNLAVPQSSKFLNQNRGPFSNCRPNSYAEDFILDSDSLSSVGLSSDANEGDSLLVEQPQPGDINPGDSAAALRARSLVLYFLLNIDPL